MKTTWMTALLLLCMCPAVAAPPAPALPLGTCLAAPTLDPDPPAYYAIELVPTKRLPGTRMAGGQTDVTFATSPFGVALTAEGEYVYDLHVQVTNLRPARQGHYVVWVTTPQLDQVVRLGVLGEDGLIKGQVAWNKFLVVITREAEPDGETWAGPVVLRGMSRSGLMHTMAGHGPFEAEPCAVYGY